jgi:hypothetical protein
MTDAELPRHFAHAEVGRSEGHYLLLDCVR